MSAPPNRPAPGASIVELLKCAVVLVALASAALQVRVKSSALATPSGVVEPTSSMSSASLHEAIDDDVNDRDWEHFALRSPILREKERERMRHAESDLRSLDRIYYINLPHRPLRRAMMEAWLGNRSSSSGIVAPHHRIEPIRGTSDADKCVVKRRMRKGRCQAVSSLARTLVAILRQRNVSGLTLVLEDDYQITVPLEELVTTTLEVVPNDWDIIRWDCSGSTHPLVSPIRVGNATVARTVLSDACRQQRENGTAAAARGCWFCGGTHAHLWRGSGADRLGKVWSRIPYNDADCVLTTPEIISYCVRFRGREIGRFMHDELPGEVSDITNPGKND